MNARDWLDHRALAIVAAGPWATLRAIPPEVFTAARVQAAHDLLCLIIDKIELDLPEDLPDPTQDLP